MGCLCNIYKFFITFPQIPLYKFDGLYYDKHC